MTKKLTIEEKLAALKARGKKVEAKAEPAKQLVLPLWPEEIRGVPNAVLRGALFTVSQKREMHKDWTPVAAVDGIEIRVKGERLNQPDLDLFEMLLHLQRDQPLGNKVEFTAHGMLKTLGRPTGGSAHERLSNDLGRLMASVTEIRWVKERKAFAGALLGSYVRDEDSGRYVVTFNADTMKLYGQGHTWIDWEQRQALGQNNLAKWLHGFYSSHAAPFAYKVETLRSLCGTTTARLGDFRKLLRTALDQLVDIKSIKGWEIDSKTDLVKVTTLPTKTQRKYLAKRA